MNIHTHQRQGFHQRGGQNPDMPEQSGKPVPHTDRGCLRNLKLGDRAWPQLPESQALSLRALLTLQTAHALLQAIAAVWSRKRKSQGANCHASLHAMKYMPNGKSRPTGENGWDRSFAALHELSSPSRKCYQSRKLCLRGQSSASHFEANHHHYSPIRSSNHAGLWLQLGMKKMGCRKDLHQRA